MAAPRDFGLGQMGNWANVQSLRSGRFNCGYCGASVASDRGYYFDFSGRGGDWAYIRICPACLCPSFFVGNEQIPGAAFGRPIQPTPPDVGGLYDEARTCTAAGAYTAAVLAARKLLMHIAVNQGAEPGDSFMGYVEYLASHGFVPPHGRGWVDLIRTKGNEANHEIRLMNQADAEDILIFVEMLLTFIYEFPSRVPKQP